MTYFNLIKSSYAKLLCSCLLIVAAGCGKKSEKDSLGKDSYHSNLQTQRSLTELAQIAKENPTNALALYNLGAAQWKAKQLDKAEISFKDSATLDTTNSKTLEFLARVQKDLGQLKDAETTLTAASTLKPDSPSIRTALADIELKQDDINNAYINLMKAIELDSNYAPALYNLAILYKDKTGNNKNAIMFFKKYLDAVNQDDLAIKKYITVAKECIRQQTEAAAAVSASSVKPFLKKAQGAIERQEYDEALILLNHAVKNNPANPDALWALALLYDKNLHYTEDANKTYKKFTTLFPKDPRSLQYASATSTQRQSPPLLQSSSQTEPLPPHNAETALKLWAKGLRFHKTKDYTQAIFFYQQALKYDDTCINAVFNSGLAYRDTANLPKARDSFIKAIKIDPDMEKAYYMLGLTYRDMKDNGKAVKYLNIALQKKPDYAMAQYQLGLIYYTEKRYDIAKTHFENCIHINNNEQCTRLSKELLKKMK